jgi:uridylate cyclase
MGLKEDLEADVRNIFSARWSTRDGTVVPDADDLKLGNDAVKFAEAVVLCADLAESTALVDGKADWLAAEARRVMAVGDYQVS